MKRESKFQKRAKNYIRNRLLGCVLIKHSDRYISGIPDLQIIYKGSVCFIELKSDTGTASKIQKVIIKRINLNGVTAGVARTIDDVDDLLEKAGMI